MVLLAPLWLALSAAALVPLLLHLRRRPRGRVVEFPAARYLARATHDHERSLRARNSLLALLRVLLVLLLALAAARPLARIGAGHGRAAVAILIDNSLSTAAVTAGRRVLDDEKDVARAVLGSANRDDHLWLVTADGRSSSGDAASLRALVDTLGALPTAGDVPGALRIASERANSVAGVTPVTVVLTDGQATTWRAAAPLPADAIWTPAAPPPPNRALIVAEPRPARWSGGGTVHVTTRGGTQGDSLAVRIEAAGRILARGVSLPDASGLGEVDIAVSDPPPGWSAARAVLAPDELPADDDRWFAIWNAPPPRVESDAGTFADRAIEALASAGVIAAGGDVDVAPANAIASRPVLATAPLDPSLVGAANRALDRAGIPWRLGAERREPARASGAGLTAVDVRRRYSLTATATGAADTLATVGGEPWIVAGDGYVLVGSAIDTAATTLPATSEFVPWLARMLSERLSSTGRPAANITPREAVAAPHGADAIEYPDGSSHAITDSLTRPPRAGVYFWTRAGVRVGAVTVNGEVEESVLQRLDDRDMRRRMPGAVVAHDAALAAGAAYRGASRRPLGSALLAAFLAVLVVEAAVAAAPGISRQRGGQAARGRS